jgi:hypothetical protein
MSWPTLVAERGPITILTEGIPAETWAIAQGVAVR